jgi:CheY-like chemotaxis protein/nitrogen-specific signal transduction histidine kinase
MKIKILSARWPWLRLCSLLVCRSNLRQDNRTQSAAGSKGLHLLSGLVSDFGVDQEEKRKRQLYRYLSVPGIIFLFFFGLWNVFTADYYGGIVDILTGCILLFSVFYLQHAQRAMALYRINTLALIATMLFWLADGGSTGEKSLWVFILPLIMHTMLGLTEGVVWNTAVFGLIVMLFFVDSDLPIFEYSAPYRFRFLCVYIVISLMTCSYEKARKAFWKDYSTYQKEKKTLEEQLARSQKMEALGLLAGGVAHDLNNVMFGLVSYPDFLMTKVSPQDPMYRSLATICDSGRKAAAIVDELLTLARRRVPSTEVLDLNEVVAEALKSAQFNKLNEIHTDVRVVLLISDKPLVVKGSPLHLSKIVMNLLSNAAEALPGGGRVVISTKACCVDRPVRGCGKMTPGNYAVLRVEDDGIGIDEKDIARIFEPFYTKKIMGRSGTGLGMAVVWGAVQDHNGCIDVQSSRKTGTVITVYLPLSNEPLSLPAPSPSMRQYRGDSESILIVDDQREQRDIATEILTNLGYKVHAVGSGEAAVDFFRTRAVDLILLDMIMDPGMDGLETYQRILALHPGQKAVIVSGFSESERVKSARELGASAYVRKPYIIEELGVAIRAALATDL